MGGHMPSPEGRGAGAECSGAERKDEAEGSTPKAECWQPLEPPAAWWQTRAKGSELSAEPVRLKNRGLRPEVQPLSCSTAHPSAAQPRPSGHHQPAHAATPAAASRWQPAEAAVSCVSATERAKLSAFWDLNGWSRHKLAGPDTKLEASEQTSLKHLLAEPSALLSGSRDGAESVVRFEFEDFGEEGDVGAPEAVGITAAELERLRRRRTRGLGLATFYGLITRWNSRRVATGREELSEQRNCSSVQMRASGRSCRTGKGFVQRWLRDGHVFLALACLMALVGSVGGWIALSEEGYTIKHNLIAEAGLKVEGDMRVNGVLISKPVANLECTAERAGSVRWNDKFFESCDGRHDWQPITFCSRDCDVNTESVPCGVPVTNKCGRDCNQRGTGLNMRQCIYNVATTPCHTLVSDMCGNDCGLAGQFACQSLTTEVGGLYLKALDDAPTTAAYEFTVGSESASAANKNSLYLTYKDAGGISQDLTLIRRLDEGDVQGMEFAKPEGQDDATFRVSMFAELTGESIELGAGLDSSHLYFDGVIDKACPFVFDGGVTDGNFTKLCLETPTQQRTVTFPDASGTVITSGNREDIDSLPALTGDNTMVYTGNYRDLADIVPPLPPRIQCDDTFQCINQTIIAPDGVTEVWDCGRLDYSSVEFDIYRVYYVVSDFDSPTFQAGPEVRAKLKEMQKQNVSRMDMAIYYAQLIQEEAGGFDPLSESSFLSDFDHMRLFTSFGAVNDYERCFTCCCGLDQNLTSVGTCNGRREKPKFCVGGDNDGLICDHSNACPGGSCVDDPSMSCFEGDHGFECWDLTQRPNFTTTINFTAPTENRRLVFPDSSGTIISTGNLEDITSLGVQVAPLVGQSTNTTTTTLQFERCFGDDCGIQQVSSVIQSNTLLVPSAADGILLTTGNLEDVTLDSGSMTGLRIQTDLQINGFLRFGEDAVSSGIRVPPREPSATYTAPHGGQRPGNHQPGQLVFLVDDSTMVLEFEPKQDAAADPSPSYLTIPAANGTVVTTGNLEAVTKEMGFMTSLSVGGMSYLEGGVTVGQEDLETLRLVGEKAQSIIFRSPVNITGGTYSNTIVSFQTQVDATSNIQFPAASGKVITTGNLPDIEHFTGELLNVSGASNLQGPVTIGTNRETPIVFSGFIEGDIISRTTPRYEEEDLFIQVPDPQTWGVERSALCKNGIPGPLRSDPLSGYPTYARFTVTDSDIIGVTTDEGLTPKKTECQNNPSCGVLIRSRYQYVQMQPTSGRLLTAWPTPDFGCDCSSWYTNITCERVLSLNPSSSPSDGCMTTSDADTRLALSALEVMPVYCGGTPCTDLDNCPLHETTNCKVLVRSHAIGTYLGVGSPQHCTIAHNPVNENDEAPHCATWRDYPSLWQLIPQETQTPYTQFKLFRRSICREIEPSTSKTELKCEAADDYIDSIEVAYFGEVNGLCGAYSETSNMCAPAADVRTFIQSACQQPNRGCRIRIDGPNITAWKLDENGMETGKTTLAGAVNCGASQPRVVVQAVCNKKHYLTESTGSETEKDVQMGASSTDATVFTFGQQKQPGGSFVPQLEDTNEIWLANAAGPECVLQKSNDFDVHWYLRDESTRLTFAPPTGTRTQRFPDVSGRIISTGNLEDITVLQGLRGSDSFIYQHGPNPDDSVTIIDFAAIGTARADRVDGALPSYALPDNSSAHPAPTQPNRRITFPDATGTVITTGNTDDLVFKSIQLQGLEMKVEATFGETDPTADPTYVNFGASSRISGCLNFVHSSEQSEYTQLCPVPPTQNNQITLPDESGTILTTGNLLGLPSLRIPDEHFFVGGDATFEGELEFGTSTTTTTLQFYTWIDGDVGLTFSGAGSRGTNVLKMNAPHMGGIDKAIRGYLLGPVDRLAVNVQGGAAFRSPVVGSERINQTTCITLMNEAGVYEYHDVGYFLVSNNLIKTTRLEGTPYAGISIAASTVSAACQHNATGVGLCSEGPCACPDAASVSPLQITMIPRERQCCAVKDAVPCVPSWDCDGQAPVCNSPQNPACAFDSATATQYIPTVGTKVLSYTRVVQDCETVPVDMNTPNGSVVVDTVECTDRNETGFHYPTASCVVGMKFETPVELSKVRIYPAVGKGNQVIGGTIQASLSAEESGNWIDLYDIVLPLTGGEWNDVDVAEIAGNKYYQVRYLGPPCATTTGPDASACSCEIAEMEFHQGSISQSFTAIVSGDHSYFVDEEALDLNAQGAMVMKCASQKWYPEYLRLKSQEMVLPENSGTLLTTGNLRDITKEAGSIGSLGVSGDVFVAGDAQIGSAGEGSVLEINALVEGRFPLAFTEAGESGSILTFHVPDPTFDNFLHFPDASGTVITTATLPTVMENLVVTETATVRGPVTMENDVTIGDKINPSTVEINSALSSAFPFSFSGSSPSNPSFTIGVEDPSDDRLLVLPDVSGTVLTTSNMPDVLDSMTFVGEAIFRGETTFLQDSVIFGEREGKSNLDINAIIGGTSVLSFEGISLDNRTISLAVEEPSGHNVITLPDVTGTVITTGNFPDILESLRVLGTAELEGEVTFSGPEVRFGNPERASKLEIKSFITGRYPLVFSDADAEGRSGSTTFEITPPTANNIISFPDVSGTVITTSNIPTTIMLPDEDYTIQSRSFVAKAGSVAMGHNAVPPTHKGSFVFTDASDAIPDFDSKRENSFNVRATGGVKFVSGHTQSGKELGVVLEPNSSSWSVLSDRDSKTDLQPVDGVEVLKKLMEVPISTWEYEGETVKHMGPMAQDFYEAFKLGEDNTRISTIDADGVALASLQGLHSLQAELEAEVEALKAAAEAGQKEVERNEERMREQQRILEEQEESMRQLMSLLSSGANKVAR